MVRPSVPLPPRVVRPSRIDHHAAERARNKTKATFKDNGGIPDLTNDELLVLLADVATELNARHESGQAKGNFPIGPMRSIPRRILA